VASDPSAITTSIATVFEPFGLPPETVTDLSTRLSTSPKLVDFLMRFQHCAPEPASSRPFTSALTIALGYFFGGLVGLVPYFYVGEGNLYLGLYISIAVMAVALFVFGYVKTCVVTGWDGVRNFRRGVWGGCQMVVVGGAAAGAAMGCVRAFDHLAK
jgi:vacuolar iron transporter family protein